MKNASSQSSFLTSLLISVNSRNIVIRRYYNSANNNNHFRLRLRPLYVIVVVIVGVVVGIILLFVVRDWVLLGLPRLRLIPLFISPSDHLNQ